jgi:tetratricopeptide (TPR) repeat protein
MNQYSSYKTLEYSRFCDFLVISIMKRNYFYVYITLCFGLFTACNSSDELEIKTPKPAVNVIELLTQAKPLFHQREDLKKLREAVKTLSDGRSGEQRNFELESTYAKYSYFLAKYSDDEKEAEKSLKDGVAAAQIALRLKPEKPDGYFWYGANLGEQSRRSPITVGISSVGEIKNVMNKVIEIQPDFEGGSAYDVLAQVELATRMTGGSAEKAVEFLEKGLSLDKTNYYLNLHLVEAYLAVKKDNEAKKQLDLVLKMPTNPDYVAEFADIMKQAKKLKETRF